MCQQTSALYQDLIRYLQRKWSLSIAEVVMEDERSDVYHRKWAEINNMIREWLDTPQLVLYGETPRKIMRREERGLPNPLPTSSSDVDCPECDELRRQASALGISLEEWHWVYTGDQSLLDQLEAGDADMDDFLAWESEDWQGLSDLPTEEESEDVTDGPSKSVDEETEDDDPFWSTGSYTFAVPDEPLLSPAFWRRARDNAWLDPVLHEAAQILQLRAGFYALALEDDGSGRRARWRSLTKAEALTLLGGLHDRGVDINELLTYIVTFGGDRISLYWLVNPEGELSRLLEILLDTDSSEDEELRSGIDLIAQFIDDTSRLLPLHARAWLQGWIDAQVHRDLSKEAGIG